MRLRPDEEWWVAPRYQLIARLRTEERRGRIQLVQLRELAPGYYGALIVRLKPRRPRWHVVTAVPTVVLLVILAVKLIIWMTPVLLLIGAFWLLSRLMTGHRAICAGLHCPGCRS